MSQKLTELDNKKAKKVCWYLPSDWFFTHLYYKLFMRTQESRWYIQKKCIPYIVAPSGTCRPLTELTAKEFTNLTKLAVIQDRHIKGILLRSSWSVVKVRHPHKIFKILACKKTLNKKSWDVLGYHDIQNPKKIHIQPISDQNAAKKVVLLDIVIQGRKSSS
jgi:hypothetical protein